MNHATANQLKIKVGVTVLRTVSQTRPQRLELERRRSRVHFVRARMVSRDHLCRSSSSRTCIVVIVLAISLFEHDVQGFAPLPLPHAAQSLRHLQTSTATVVRSPQPLAAGGFEWDDPEEAFDQGVENPFKKNNAQVVDSTNSEDDAAQLKVDPARLLSPRLNGSNLYLVGMMGSGKSSVGQIVAKREYRSS